MQDMIKTAAVVGVVLVAGTLLSSIDPIAGANLLWWPLSSVVKFGMYAGSAVLVGLQGEKLARGYVIGNSWGLTGILKAALIALVSLLTYGAITQVIAPDLMGPAETAFAMIMVGVAGYTIWKVYDGFDDVAALVKARPAKGIVSGYGDLQLHASPTVTPLPLATRHKGADRSEILCARCASPVPEGNSFCGICGTRVLPADRSSA